MEQLRIDLVPMGVTPNAHASQFDVGRVIRFLLYNGGTAYTLAGTETITVKMAKPDGTEETVNVTNTSSNYVDFITEDGLLNLAGLYPCEISITSGTDVIGSKNFNLRVELDPYDGHNIRTVTVGPADICTFTTDLPEFFPSVKCSILATGGNGTPDNPIPINGYTEANIVNTQNESIVDLFSIDSDFRGTVAFNQLVNKDNIPSTTTINDITFTNNGDGSITASGTASALASFNVLTEGQYMPISGHKYYVCGCPSNGSDSTYRLRFTSGSISETGNGTIFTGGLAKNLTCQVMNGYIISGNLTFKPMLFDLTAMFGSTIADYIYTLEQNNAGAGVAFFSSIYPADYYDYDSGTTELVGKETPEATIAFGQTVYGGVVDFTRGKLTVTHGYKDLSDVVFGSTPTPTADSSVCYYGDISGMVTETSISLMIAENYSASAGIYINQMTANTMIISGGKLYVALPVGETQPVGDFVYPLATPFDIDLTPVQIRALVGQNNVFADTGDTEVKYLTEG